MFSWVLKFCFILCVASCWADVPFELPPEKAFENYVTCEQFEKDAQFDPRTIVDSTWRIFYTWSSTTEVRPIRFSLAEKKSVKNFKTIYDAVMPDIGIPWETGQFFMQPRAGVLILFLHAITPGAYRAVVRMEQSNKERPRPPPLFKLADVRLKQVGRVLGMMSCEEFTAFAMIRTDELPKNRSDCEAAATTIGYRGHPGYCYLEITEAAKENTDYKKFIKK